MFHKIIFLINNLGIVLSQYASANFSTQATTPSSNKILTPTTTTAPTIDAILMQINSSLDQMNSKNINETDLLMLSEHLKDTFNEYGISTNYTLINVVMLVDKMQNFSKYMSNDTMQNFTYNMIESFNQVLDSNRAWDEVTDRVGVSSTILKTIQNIGFSLGCYVKKQSANKKVITSNIAVQAYRYASDGSSQNWLNIKMNNSRSGFNLPPGIPQIDNDNGCFPGTAVGSLVAKLSSYLAISLDNYLEINSNILACSIKDNFNSTQLPGDISPVQVILEHINKLELGDRVNCVYWDFNEMKWSSKGCRFQPINSTRMNSICECNHLTNFAALLDMSGRETDTKAKDILTIVCCGLSIVCEVMTIGILTLIPTLHNRRNAITSNLCISLLAVHLLIIFGMDSTQNNVLCQTVAALLLFFILCSFSWMLMEGYQLYQMIILVFSSVGYLKLIYLYLIGYGVPVLITICAIFSIGLKDLRETDSYFCWISSPLYPYRVWAVAAPALVVIFLNTVIMFLTLKEAYPARSKHNKCQVYQVDIQNDTDKYFTRIKGSVSLLFLLGIPWLSFILYIHEYGNFFSYIFIIFNGLQGVFIFIFQILLNEKVHTLAEKTFHNFISSHYLFSNSKTTSTNNSEVSNTTNNSNRD